MQQGYLGDCYFLSALAAIAMDATRINKILINKKFTASKAFVASVRIRGRPWLVGVDTSLPFYKSYNSYLFGKGAK